MEISLAELDHLQLVAEQELMEHVDLEQGVVELKYNGGSTQWWRWWSR
jgi:hypothetical protein